MSPLLAGVRNNAEWCDLVCRVHGATTCIDRSAWSSATRTPSLYPDAVTLEAAPSIVELLARIDRSPGCSIKDSFASIDLRPFGFHVLFDAEWIVNEKRTYANAGSVRWERLRQRDDLVAWEAAWSGGGDHQGTFRPELLNDSRVTFLASYADDRIVSGAILNLHAGVVGISNFFAGRASRAEAWRDCASFAQELNPGLPLVGYGSGPTLQFALQSGFISVGPLRVWVLDG